LGFTTTPFTTVGEGGSDGCAFPVAIADFNRDGYPDIALPNENSITLHMGAGDGTSSSPAHDIPYATYRT
jgi:hypothetical protein